MIITKTPFRMSFFGGGTDMVEFFSEHGGAVISTTIDKYCYVHVRHLPRFFEYRNHITYTRIEKVNHTDEIRHPAVRESMKYLDMHELVITYDADLPSRSGLGTSSSFAVGLLSAFYAMKGKYVDKNRLAREAIYLERTLCNEAGGWQDQIAASYGGLNRIDFFDNTFKVSPVVVSAYRKKLLNESLMLFFTGFSRFSAEIQNDTKKNLSANKDRLLEMKGLVNEAEKVLTNKDISLDNFGKLMDYSWQLKRKTGNQISTDSIDQIYNNAKKAGAIGGKLLGAGGGGFLLLYVPREKQLNVRGALSNLLYVPFKFENNGSEIIYYSPEEYPPIEI